jgi:hypothetical protein
MSSLSDFEAISINFAIILHKKYRRKKRSKWYKSWLLQRKRFSHTNVLEELCLEPDDWRNYFRADEESCIQLLQLLTPYIKKKDTNMRLAISPHERLSAMLRYLATGRKYADLKFTTAMSSLSLCKIASPTRYHMLNFSTFVTLFYLLKNIIAP